MLAVLFMLVGSILLGALYTFIAREVSGYLSFREEKKALERHNKRQAMYQDTFEYFDHTSPEDDDDYEEDYEMIKMEGPEINPPIH